MSDATEHIGFQAPEPSDLAHLFPGYKIESLIASGGMGAVYCAVQKSLDRTVALKILPSELSSDASFRAGFESEAKAMARLNHPNLIGVYDFGEVGGMLYIIMEYVPGKSVYHSAYGIAIDQTEVVRLMTGICHGLAHAHEYGIIHRDIKPANILLDLNAQPKIGDFGLARPADRKFEEGEGIFGTPHYTAPEVVDHPHSVDHRADIFSVGVMLHELLTSRLPADDPRTASAIINCDHRFDYIISRATNPDPNARYASANDLAHDLQVIGASIGKHTPVSATAIPRPHHARGPIKVKKSANSTAAMALTGIAVLALLAGGLYWFTAQPPKKKEPAEPTVVVIPPRTTDPGQTEPPPESPAPPTKPPTEEPIMPPASEPKPEEAVASNDTPKPEMPEEVKPPEPEVVKAPEVPALPAPRFDVPGFLARGRKIMQDKARPSMVAAKANLKTNMEDFERGLQRLAKKEENKDVKNPDGDDLEAAITREIASLSDQGYKIPESLPINIASITDVDRFSEKYIQVQTGIVDTLNQQLAELSFTYILGLEKQIERLRPDNDVGAIALIEEEIKSTKVNPEHFPKLMRGE
jgi:serine/threonine protein kinase